MRGEGERERERGGGGGREGERGRGRDFIYSFASEISQETGINADDLISSLQYYGFLKYWKGKHIIIKKKVSHDIHMTTT